MCRSGTPSPFQLFTDNPEIFISNLEHFWIICICFIAGRPLTLLRPTGFFQKPDSAFTDNPKFLFQTWSISGLSAFASLPDDRSRSFVLPVSFRYRIQLSQIIQNFYFKLGTFLDYLHLLHCRTTAHALSSYRFLSETGFSFNTHPRSGQGLR